MASELGDLTTAITSQRTILDDQPDDGDARLILAILLSLSRLFEESSELATNFDPELADSLTADRLRHAAQALPKLCDPPESLTLRHKSLQSLDANQPRLASRQLDQAESRTEPSAGPIYCNGIECESWRDLDDVLGSTIELFYQGQWFWVAASQWRSLRFLDTPIELEDPVLIDVSDLRSRYVRPVTLEWTNGDIWTNAMMPMLYAHSGAHPDDEIRLGLSSDCTAQPDGPTRGIGGRIWLVDGEEVPVSIVETLEQSGSRLRLL